MLHENNIQLRFVGDRTRLSDKLLQKIHEVETLTRQNTGLVLCVAVDYSGQWDICTAMQKIAQQVEAGQLTSQAISPELIAQYLSAPDLPEPDFFIRTSGEIRISNFMLWPLAYCELYFTDVLWPDFNEIELEKALQQFSQRERRFGNSKTK
jgi:undecaprenyl diphosphate synthase